MRYYWGLGVGHTYARISTTAARKLYLTLPHRFNEHEAQEVTPEQPEDVDEDEELGDNDMVFQDDDVDSDSSSIFGLGDAEFEARDDMYGY